jgi:hypothetical protein
VDGLTEIGKVVGSLAQPVQGFLGKLLGPASSEAGELLADNIRFIRWKNTLKILEKAQKEMEIRGIQPKEVPLKTLLPVLEGASLESDDVNLQDKWANLLISAASGNLSRPSYPKILSELVQSEAQILDYLYAVELRIVARKVELKKVDQEYRDFNDVNARTLWRKKKQEVMDSFAIPRDAFRLSKIREHISLQDTEFPELIDNLLRLRLCVHPEDISEVEVLTGASLSKYEKKNSKSSTEVEEDYDLDVEEESITSRVVDENSINLTQLGMGFMKACQPLSQ